MIYLELFLSFVKIGLFSIGGGHAALPLIQHEVTQVHTWLTATQFSDVLVISEMTPGPIAINSATFVGIQIAGLPGAICATLGCILPSFIIVTLLSYLYTRFRTLSTIQGILAGLKPAVVALIASAGVSLFVMAVFPEGIHLSEGLSVDFIALILFLAAFITLRIKNPSPIVVMAGCGAAGLVLYSIF